MALVLTLAQVSLGFRIISESDQMLVMAHYWFAVAILVLLADSSILAARQRGKSTTSTA